MKGSDGASGRRGGRGLGGFGFGRRGGFDVRRSCFDLETEFREMSIEQPKKTTGGELRWSQLREVKKGEREDGQDASREGGRRKGSSFESRHQLSRRKSFFDGLWYHCTPSYYTSQIPTHPEASNEQEPARDTRYEGTHSPSFHHPTPNASHLLLPVQIHQSSHPLLISQPLLHRF